jgi:hypothetical protein
MARKTTDHQNVANAVLYYSQLLKLRVFPLHDVSAGRCSCAEGSSCTRPGKHPRIRHWQDQATTDATTIDRWWRRWPNANIGIPTGRINNLIVIDIDYRDDGLANHEVYLRDRLPPTYTVDTGGHGRHLWFRYPADLPYDITNANKFPPGIDFRANGGYVLAAPSKTNKGAYPWPEVIPYDEESLQGVLGDIPRSVCDEYLKRNDADIELVSADSVKVYERLSAKEKARIERYTDQALTACLDELDQLRHRSQWDNETFRLSCKVLELAKAPWCPLTYQDAVSAIRKHVPPEDGKGWTRTRITKKIESAWNRVTSTDLVRPYPKDLPAVEPATPEPSFRFTPASHYQPKAVEWLWDKRVAKGALALLAGREDVGKSFVALTLAADLTHGTVDGCWNGRPKNVLYIATEDSWSHTIVPRLMAMGADLDKVFNLELRDDETDLELSLVMQRHMKHLEAYIASDNIGLIILDPIISSLGDVNTYKSTEVRTALAELVKVCERTGCSILGVMHFNKMNSRDVLNAIAESKAFTQVARSVLVVAKDSDAEERRILSVQKSNLGPKPKSLVYEIRNTVVGRSINIGKLHWLGETDTTAEEAHQQRIDGTNDVGTQDCAYFIKSVLLNGNGMVESQTVFTAGGKEGWTKDQLKRTKSKLRVGSKRVGEVWFWIADDAQQAEWRSELMM